MGNTSECGWPEREFSYIWHHPGFEYTDIVLRPIWLFICTVGNITNILLLRRIKTFQATFLVSVAFFDLVFMWSWMALYVRDRVGVKNINNPSVWAFLVTCEFLGNVSSQVSDWVLVAFSLTRLLTIIDPFGMVTRFTKWKMRILIICLIPFAVASNLYPVAEYATKGNKEATDTWIKDWLRVQEVGSMAAPISTFFAMFLINAIVIGLLMKRHMLNRASSGQGVGGVVESKKFAMNVTRNKKGITQIRSHGREKRTATTVRLLTAAVVTYLICRLPFVIWFVILQLERKCITHLNDEQSAIFLPFYYQFLYALYSINFLVYCGVSREFFWKVIWMITHCRRPKAKSDLDRSRDTEMTNAGTISDDLERALELQARRESERPYTADSLSDGSESEHSTGQAGHTKQQIQRNTNDPADEKENGQSADGQTDQRMQQQETDKQAGEREEKGGPESRNRTVSRDLERAPERQARQETPRPVTEKSKKERSPAEINAPKQKKHSRTKQPMDNMKSGQESATGKTSTNSNKGRKKQSRRESEEPIIVNNESSSEESKSARSPHQVDHSDGMQTRLEKGDKSRTKGGKDRSTAGTISDDLFTALEVQFERESRRKAVFDRPSLSEKNESDQSDRPRRNNQQENAHGRGRKTATSPDERRQK